tara:strand:+ start:593 stop:1768 length:1176 start_codon:yes stop_codon:yes gene_type:complete
MNKRSVVIKGPLLTQSGYGVHSRQVFKWLISREDFDVKCIVTPWGHCSWLLDRSNNIIEEIMSRTINEEQNQSFDMSFQIQLPNEWNPFIASKNIGITAAVETTSCNPEWVNNCNNMDLVITPSEFTKQVLVNTGLEENKVSVVHETYPEIFDNTGLNANSLKNFLDNLDTKKNFLIVGQITGLNTKSDRKNLFNTLKAFISAYKDDKEVGLILKTNSGRNTKIDKYKTINIIKSIINDVGKKEFPRIHFLHGNLTESELYELYTNEKVNYFISASRGEGFGLPLIESARLGLPVIATNWSGHLDFLKLGNFTRLNYDLVEIDDSRVDNKIFIKGTKWAEVPQGHLRLVLKKAFLDYGKKKKNAKELAVKIKENFNFDKIKKDYDKAIEGI